jgi:serine protease Do
MFLDEKTQETTELRIRFSDKRGCLGSIIAADPRSDLAVLQLNWEKSGIKQTDFPALKWETAAAPRKGQFVILMGNPYAIARDGSASVSWGMISNLTRQPISVRTYDVFDRDEATSSSMLYRLGAVMQLDARLNLGTSGGPVLNLKGELIGISTSLAAVEGYDQSAGFALPIDSLTRRIVRTLLAGQEVEYGMLGIRPREIGGQEFLELNLGLPQRSAASVEGVAPGSPAGQAHIHPDDVIVRVENEPVRSVADLMRLVGLHSPDSEIDVTLWRRAQRRLDTVRVRLGKWPVQDDEGIIETNPRYAAWRGLSIDFATARGRFRADMHGADVARVLITKVADNSPGRTALLEPGDFITHVGNVPVQSPAEFYAAVKGLTGTVSLRLMSNDQNPTRQNGRVVQIREN